METLVLLAGLIVALGLSAHWWWKRNVDVTTVHDYEKALLYRRGKLSGVLGAGRYYTIRTYSKIVPVDMRKSQLYVPAQEIFTKDKIQIKLTIGGFYQVADVLRARHISDYSNNELYAVVQKILRNHVAELTLDEILERRQGSDETIAAAMAEKAPDLGLDVFDIAIRDIMIPAGLRKAYAGILEAKKDALKKLEQARGEQAVLRNLANSSAMYDKNPMLLQARLIQTLSSGANTIVFKAGEGISLPQEIAASPST